MKSIYLPSKKTRLLYDTLFFYKSLRNRFLFPFPLFLLFGGCLSPIGGIPTATLMHNKNLSAISGFSEIPNFVNEQVLPILEFDQTQKITFTSESPRITQDGGLLPFWVFPISVPRPGNLKISVTSISHGLTTEVTLLTYRLSLLSKDGKLISTLPGNYEFQQKIDYTGIIRMGCTQENPNFPIEKGQYFIVIVSDSNKPGEKVTELFTGRSYTDGTRESIPVIGSQYGTFTIKLNFDETVRRP